MKRHSLRSGTPDTGHAGDSPGGLEPPAGIPMSALFDGSRIPPGSTVAEARLHLGRIVRETGLDRMAYVTVSPPRGCRADIYGTAITDYPQAWGERYIERDYVLLDPVVERATRETRPFFWTAGGRYPDPRQRRMMAEAQDFGLGHGLTLPVRSADGALGLFSAVASDAERVRAAASGHIGRLLAAACDAHEFAVGRLPGLRAGDGDDPGDGPGLSARERECLLWVLEGKTAAATAVILGLSVFTVNRHVHNATCKLGSRNKHHAAVQALRCGLI